jgi:hypothetical protein
MSDRRLPAKLAPTFADRGYHVVTPLPLYPGERAPGTHWIGGWMDPRAGVDDVEKRKFLALPRLELRPLGRPARSQSLYRLSYLGSKGKAVPVRGLGGP